jgi:antitoxin VapB
MGMSIKRPETENLAREIAARTGESLTEAIQRALEERLDRLKRERKSKMLMLELEEIIERVHRLPVLDRRSPEEVLGYDESGLPQSNGH